MGVSKALTIIELQSIVESTGAKLISKEYLNNHTPIEFLCSNCGKLWTFTWKKFSKGQNRNLLCGDCLRERNKKHLREMGDMLYGWKKS